MNDLAVVVENLGSEHEFPGQLVIAIGKQDFCNSCNNGEPFTEFRQSVNALESALKRNIPSHTHVYWVGMTPYRPVDGCPLNAKIHGANNCIARACALSGFIYVSVESVFKMENNQFAPGRRSLLVEEARQAVNRVVFGSLSMTNTRQHLESYKRLAFLRLANYRCLPGQFNVEVEGDYPYLCSYKH